MEYISSDTNVWVDFMTIGRTELPFRLPYKYIMWEETITEEFLTPEWFRETMLACGLNPVEITIEEFMLAEEYGSKYIKLSVHDRIALAIAKERNITLLTGDGALRKAANKERVKVMGTLAIMDKLHDGNYIDDEEFCKCLERLEVHNGGIIRLPKEEIAARLEKVNKK